MLLFGLAFMAIVTLYPTYLTSVLGTPLALAGLMVGISSLTMIPGGPLAGWSSDKLKTRKWVIFAGFLLLVPLVATLFQLSESMVIPAMILLGVCASILLGLLNTVAPEVAGDPSAAPMSLALVAAFLNLSIMIGPPLLGGLVDSVGWVTAGYVLAAAPVLGLVIVLLNEELR
jgi:MFS family permease